MTAQETLRKVTVHGSNIGQIALAEFILKSYEDELSPKLTIFLEKVVQNMCDSVGKTVDKPAEDVALAVSHIIDKVNK